MQNKLKFVFVKDSRDPQLQNMKSSTEGVNETIYWRIK